MGSQALSQTLKNRLEALGAASDSERLRLALNGADIAVFDWDVADDTIQWDCAEKVLKAHLVAQRLETGQGFRTWIGPNACERLIEWLRELWPTQPNFTLEFEAMSLTEREWFELRAVRVAGPGGSAERVTGVLRAVTEQKNTLARLSYSRLLR
ncbi:MAG: hypothetical protein EXR00_01335 [Alphaproteobacteria bacterium]|nr:hypothetical protein [Alphaproteobacteria bacterium]